MGLHNNVVAINSAVSRTALYRKKFKKLKKFILCEKYSEGKEYRHWCYTHFITMNVNNSIMFCVFLFSNRFFNVFSVSD